MGDVNVTHNWMQELKVKLDDLGKYLDECRRENFFRNMLVAHKLLIDKYLPFKVGDRVRITKNVNDVWPGKHFMTIGAIATIVEIGIWDEDKVMNGPVVAYFLEFDTETFINTVERQEQPVTQKHSYCFRGEEYFERIPNKIKDV